MKSSAAGGGADSPNTSEVNEFSAPNLLKAETTDSGTRAASPSRNPPSLVMIPTNAIEVGRRIRMPRPDQIKALAANLPGTGDRLPPIEVVVTEDSYRLVTGLVRLLVAVEAGRPTVEALVLPPLSEAEARRREIAENWIRLPLTALEKAESVAALRELFEQENGPVRRGRRSDPAGEEGISALGAQFSIAVQEQLDLGRRSVFLYLQIAAGISGDLRERLSSHPIADHRSELLELSVQAPARQAQLVALLVDEGIAGLDEAIARLDRLPPPRQLELFERLSDSFARLKPQEQFRFFDMHAAEIARWQASKTGSPKRGRR